MEYVEYIEIKEMVEESFDEFINTTGFNKEGAIAATLEDIVLLMRDYNHAYVCVLINLGIISMTNNFLPDYIFERIERIKEIKLDLTGNNLSQYLSDLKDFNRLIEKNDFKIDVNIGYTERVNVILKD